MLAEGSGERKAAPAPAAAAPGGPRPLGFSMALTELGGHPAIGLSPASPPAGPAFGPGAAAGARALLARAAQSRLPAFWQRISGTHEF